MRYSYCNIDLSLNYFASRATKYGRLFEKKKKKKKLQTSPKFYTQPW